MRTRPVHRSYHDGGYGRYAPAGRADQADLTALNQLVLENALLQALIETVDGYLLVLNRERQVVAANHKALEDLDLTDVTALLGRRPGESIGCIHAAGGPDGCGTGKACASCGALIAILASQEEGRPVTEECLATVRRNGHLEAVEFRVRATPVRLGESGLTVVVLNDISAEKRREALERTFFHDLMNTLTGLLGWSGVLRQGGAEADEAAEQIHFLAERLRQEIEDQVRLSQAECGTLRIVKRSVAVCDVLEMVQLIFANHEVARERTLTVAEVDPAESVSTDPSLLVRVLTNMVRNALEAVPPGETVRLWYESRAGAAVFLVQNPGVIPEAVALRIFQRSFSTKAESGRGVGTYSMKLFGERYLGGRVAFECSPEEGTVFSITLPPA